MCHVVWYDIPAPLVYIERLIIPLGVLYTSYIVPQAHEYYYMIQRMQRKTVVVAWIVRVW